MELTRTCNVCQVTKDLEDFPEAKSDGYTYRRGYCKECQRKKYREARKRRHATNPESKAKDTARDKKWREDNPEKVKLTQLRTRAKKRGLDPGQIVDYYKSHDGKCEICKVKPVKQDLALDHCHRTGEFRGLLCNRCNLALGQVEDSYYILSEMINYLGRHIDATIDRPLSYDNPVAEQRILEDIKGYASGKYIFDAEYFKQLFDMLAKLRNPELR